VILLYWERGLPCLLFLLKNEIKNISCYICHWAFCYHGVWVDLVFLFGLPLWLGNWVLVTLWLIPMWLYALKKKQVLKRLWFLVLLSVLLIGIFVFYLPGRFQSAQAMEEDHSNSQEIEESSRFSIQSFFIQEVFADEVADGDVADEDHEDHDDTAGQKKPLVPLVSPKWWLYLAVSVGAMSLLSFGIYKFITMKHEPR